VGKADLLEEIERRPLAMSIGSRGPLPPLRPKSGPRLPESRSRKGGGGVGEVVRIGEDRPLVPQPPRARRARVARGRARRGLARPPPGTPARAAGELVDRPLVVGPGRPGRITSIPPARRQKRNASTGSPGSCLDPREPLLRSRRHQDAVLEQAAGRLVDERRRGRGRSWSTVL